MHELIVRTTGFVASLALTLVAYFIIISPETFSLSISNAITIIFALALIQSLIQLIFFIDVWQEKGAGWNAAVFISTASIIFIVVFFSVWIMNHLNYHMH